MKGSDKFFAQHHAKQLEKQMEKDIEDMITDEQQSRRPLDPAYMTQPTGKGWKVEHGGTIGFTDK